MEPEPLPLKKRKKKKNLIDRKNTELTDGQLCERSRTWQGLFLKYLSHFEAFDANLNNAFALDWMAQIEALEKHPSDENFVDSQQEVTDLVKQKTNALSTLLGGIEYFVKAAYPDNGRVLMEFGFEKMTKPEQTGIARLLVNAFAMLKVMTDYEADLLAVGMPATLQGEFETATNNLADAEVEQEYQKRLRIRSTAQRIRLFNTLYDTFTKVHKAADVVFREQPEVSKMFGV